MNTTQMRCRRCQTALTDDDEYCPTCNAGPLKALIQLGTLPNGHQVNLYLDYAEHGPQIAVLRALMAKFHEQAEVLKQIRPLAEAWADPTMGDQILAVLDKLNMPSVDGQWVT